jgi:hypothetical protein
MLAGAKVEPSHVAPLHANRDVAVDLQDEMPFAGAGKVLRIGLIHLRVFLPASSFGYMLDKLDALGLRPLSQSVAV